MRNRTWVTVRHIFCVETSFYHFGWLNKAFYPSAPLADGITNRILQATGVMKSRDILSPDIGPGIRTQDSVVTSGWTTSDATEAVSSAWYSLMKSRDILSPDIGPGIRTQDSVRLIQPPWRNWQFNRWLPRNPGFESRGRYPEIKYL